MIAASLFSMAACMHKATLAAEELPEREEEIEETVEEVDDTDDVEVVEEDDTEDTEEDEERCDPHQRATRPLAFASVSDPCASTDPMTITDATADAPAIFKNEYIDKVGRR